jgi:hypothetical protein
MPQYNTLVANVATIKKKNMVPITVPTPRRLGFNFLNLPITLNFVTPLAYNHDVMSPTGIDTKRIIEIVEDIYQ